MLVRVLLEGNDPSFDLPKERVEVRILATAHPKEFDVTLLSSAGPVYVGTLGTKGANWVPVRVMAGARRVDKAKLDIFRATKEDAAMAMVAVLRPAWKRVLKGKLCSVTESDYADYDPSLDPFKDPKNLPYSSLGYTYVSREDTCIHTNSWNWIEVLRHIRLLPYGHVRYDYLTPDEREIVNNVDRIYVESAPRGPEERARIYAELFTREAIRRLSFELGPPSDYGSWCVRVVHVEYK